MTTPNDHSAAKPLQFGLASLFAFTAIVAVCLPIILALLSYSPAALVALTWLAVVSLDAFALGFTALRASIRRHGNR